MLFNSFEFILFLCLFMFAFFSVPRRWQPVLLLVASYLFYMGWRPSFALLLGFTTVVDYSTALVMAGTNRRSMRHIALIVALTINLGILATVKYLDFALANVVGVAGWFGYVLPNYALGLVIPIGISFYTFQSIGYTIDVYNRKIEAERNFLTYAQYVAFFPQLVAGPIERAGHMLPQFRRTHLLRRENMAPGLWLIGYGLFKKMCVADVIAPVVSAIYASPADFNGSYQIVATVLFGFQIYCDFSGYSDIARGVARLIDFELMINFRQPYFSTSLTEFWRRWHISLSTWFRDFLYIPLGGSRHGSTMAMRNTLFVFIASGIWHGASWTFIIWGALHGMGLVIERVFQSTLGPLIETTVSKRLVKVGGWLWTMSIVMVGWIFFRSNSLSNAIITIDSLRHPGSISYGTFKTLHLASFEILMLILSILILLIVDWIIYFAPQQLERFCRLPRLSIVISVGLFYYIILFGVFGHVDFIYFQF